MLKFLFTPKFSRYEIIFGLLTIEVWRHDGWLVGALVLVLVGIVGGFGSLKLEETTK